MKYEFMEEHREAYRAKSMCEVLKVSRSGYYAWRTRQPSIRQKDNDELLCKRKGTTPIFIDLFSIKRI